MARRPADLGIKPDVLRDLAEAEAHEQSLYSFVARAWQEIEGRPFKGGWAFEAICEHLEAVSAGEIDFLIINVPPRSGKTTTATVCWPAWTWARRKDKVNPRIGPSVQFLCGAYSARKAQDDAVTSRRLIGSAWYQRLWGTRYQITEDRDNRERFDTSEHGSRISTGMAESLGKGGLIRLLDDPHKTDEMESDEVRKSVLRDYDEVWKTRGNDAVNQAEVVIMQRLARDDLTGHILDSDIGEDVVHLWIPARFEADRACRTVIGWRDPREEDGESFHPERFPDGYLNSVEAAVGPYAWCNPGEAPVLMSDLSQRPIREVRDGDEIVGFEEDSSPRTAGQACRKRSLVRAKVLSISRSRRAVVRIVLDSGDVIRCTPDHRWYTRRGSASDHAMYLPAAVGRVLMRICPPSIRGLEGEDLHHAGWLAGFFDGEGSVGHCDKDRNRKPAPVITFSQGTVRNLCLCEKLEKTLAHFAFEFGFRERERSDRRQQTGEKTQRYYWLRTGKNSLPVAQRLLHEIRVTKWRDRLIDAAYRSKFVNGKERVVSIEPDGEEDVFGLETTTGNYVVWGLASSNSGQFQQRPAPRGGGIIKEEWWQNWPPPGEEDQWEFAEVIDGRKKTVLEYPEFIFILAATDGAFTEKQGNDPCAATVWGIFKGPYGEAPTAEGKLMPRILLIEAWRERLELSRYAARLKEMCQRRNVDRLLIENKASGYPVAQELRRLLSAGDAVVEIVDPGKADKVARLHSTVPLFSGGCVYRPSRRWADQVAKETAEMPNGRYDDLADTVSMALNWLRRSGVALLSAEAKRKDTEERLFRGRAAGKTVAQRYGVV